MVRKIKIRHLLASVHEEELNVRNIRLERYKLYKIADVDLPKSRAINLKGPYIVAGPHL